MVVMVVIQFNIFPFNTGHANANELDTQPPTAPTNLLLILLFR